MGYGVKNKFVRHGLFWFITRLIVVVILASLVFTKNVGIIILFVIIFVVYVMALVLIPPYLVKKTANKIKEKDFHVDWCEFGYYGYLMIDTQNGRIAAIWTTSPFTIQIIDAEQLTDVHIFQGNGRHIGKKTTNRIGVDFWIGKKKYTFYTYYGGREFVFLESNHGQEYIKNATIIYAKLNIAKGVASRHGAISRSEMSLENFITKEQISQVNSLILEGRKVEAIKIIQYSTNMGLAHAKEIVDHWELYYQGIK